VENFVNISNECADALSAIRTENAMLDVRAIANFVLDVANAKDVPVSNMALNKIVYFLHCDYLMEQKQPLVGAKIEAWKHGPVFRELYHEFKVWDDKPIKSRANKVDPHTGEVMIAKAHFGSEEAKYISSLVERYIHFSAAQLRALSHIEGSPWHQVWDHSGRSNPGMKISDDLITKYYSQGALQ